jgi:hypothetical protein
MHIKTRLMNVDGVDNATVVLKSGDYVVMEYKDAQGKEHTLTITAQHLLLSVEHLPSNKALLMSPSMGVRFVD